MNSGNTEQDFLVDAAERFGCDRALLEETLRRVQSGELSPANATTELLALPPAQRLQAKADSLETLASLIARLGAPPQDIVDQWCWQMRFAAVEHSASKRQPLPAIDLHQWSINQQGQMHFHGRPVTLDAARNADEIDRVSADHISRFRESLISSGPNLQPMVADQLTETIPSQGSCIDESSRTRTTSQAKPKRKPSRAGRFAGTALVVLCLAAIAWILNDATHPHSGRQANQLVSESDLPKPSGSIFDPGVTRSPSATEIDADPATAALPKVRLESLTDRFVDDAFSDPVTDSERETADFSLETLMPAASGFEHREPADFEHREPADLSMQLDQVEPIEPLGAAGSADFDADTIDPLAEPEGPEPEESPQATRTSKVDPVTSITLPPAGQADVATELLAHRANSFRLQFPFEVPLRLRDAETVGEIIDMKQEVAVATIRAGGDGMQISWTPAASKTASATALIHGRLTTDAGDLVYLRPIIEADPLPIDLQRADIRPTWDLLGSMPPRVTRLTIQLQLPDGVEQGWIEPIDPASPRRARGVAVLTPTEGESVSLGMRFDIRGGRKLSCRVRYAARLDPEATWQVVSRPLLEQLADQLASQSEILAQQTRQLSAIYAQADSGARRAVAAQRDAMEERGKSIRQLSERVAKLQSLVAKVEAGGRLKVRLWVEWPNQQQTLLETK